MSPYLITELHTNTLLLAKGLIWLVVCAAVCVPLTAFFPASHDQPRMRRGLLLDACYWMLDSVAHRPVIMLLTFLLLKALAGPHAGRQPTLSFLEPLRHLPLLLQFLLVTLAIDFLQYWVHRALHRSALWGFHSIHHSSRHLDWLSSARLHPVNTLLYSILPGFIVALAGMKPEAYGLYALFITVYSPLLHSNIHWTFGPLRYVVGSPVYHRWHHAMEPCDKNFAFFFPFIDCAFGTFYMPDGQLPAQLGTHDPVPDGFWRQLVYPFKKRPAPAQEIKNKMR